MITLEEAKLKAKKLNSRINTLTEEADSYHFYIRGVDDSTIVVLKKNGECLDMMEYIDYLNKNEEQ